MFIRNLFCFKSNRLIMQRERLILLTVFFSVVYLVTNFKTFTNLIGFDRNQLLYSSRDNNHGNHLKKILFYNDYFSYTESTFSGGQELFKREKCPVNSCYITANRHEFAPEHLSAVIWHGNGLDKSFPTKRYSHIEYIFYLLEPPVNADAIPEELNTVFNYTMTYRRDSDIYAPYDSFIEIPNGKSLRNAHVVNYAENKTKMALWLASRCFSWSKRERLVETLQTFLEVDVLGFCGPNKCHDSYCFDTHAKEHKFYLAFENSLCEDYITEKFFKCFGSNIVPVVYGSGDYGSIAPRQSYINVMDFESPKLLADYLLYLDKNDTAYNEYFEWKNHYKLIGVDKARLCALCAKLHSDRKKKEYTNLSDWYNKDKCKAADNHLVQDGDGVILRSIRIIFYFVIKLFSF